MSVWQPCAGLDSNRIPNTGLDPDDRAVLKFVKK